jgi:stress response protein YsnF
MPRRASFTCISEYEVTLHAKEPVVAKETVPVERVRLNKDTVAEQVSVNERFREEEAQVDRDYRARIVGLDVGARITRSA